MPKALNADRELARALYLQGLKPVAIAERLKVNPTTVKTWSNRYGWNGLAAQVRDTLTQVSLQAVGMQVATDVKAMSDDVRKQLAGHIKRCTDVVSKSKPPKTLNGVQRQTEQVSELVTQAVKVFGWSDAKQSAVNVLLLNGQDQSMQDATEKKHAFPGSGTVIDIPGAPSEPGVVQSETPCRSTLGTGDVAGETACETIQSGSDASLCRSTETESRTGSESGDGRETNAS